MRDIITLISETYTTDSIGQKIPVESTRDVWADIESVTRSEVFSGGRAGLNPELVATTLKVNYSGEKIASYNGVRFSVYRTHLASVGDDIELYLERRTGA